MPTPGEWFGGLTSVVTPAAYPEPTGNTSVLTDDKTQVVAGKAGTTAVNANAGADKALLHWSAGIVLVSLVALWLLGGIVFKPGGGS